MKTTRSELDYTAQRQFINNTDLSRDEAMKLVNQWTEKVNQAETELSESMRIGERMMDLHKNKIWDESDMAFFASFDATPIEFSVARPLVNNLISRQRKQKFQHSFVPLDAHSETRLMEQVMQKAQKNIENFSSETEAIEFYRKYADDSYAQMITALLKKFKDINGTKWKETECFEGGVITGADFLKVDVDQYGRPIPVRRNLSRMVWDANSTEYDRSDAEFIGDKVRWYKNDLIMKFPDLKDVIEQQYEHFTNLRSRNRFAPNQRWRDWWKFEQDQGLQVKLVDLCYRDIEERIIIVDNETGDERYADSGMEEDEVLDMLSIKIFNDAQNLPQEQQEQLLDGENARENVLAMVEQRYDLEYVYMPCWYQMVFTFNGLFLHQKVPYPFNGHPYMPFHPQFNDGYFNGFLEDIEDIVIALNKALSIRELMMAHSAKGMLVVDEKVLDDSDLTIDDVADEYTRIGGMLVLKLKYHKSIQDVMQQINTVGEGIPAINNIIQDYDERLFRISGVNLAQLGITQGETPASRFKMQLTEGETTNALMFDNFVRSLEEFYKQKMIPMCVEYAKNNPHAVKRLIGDELGQWADIEFGQSFSLFESGVKSGEYSFTLTPTEDHSQARTQFADKLMELAFGGAVPIELALEFSPLPNRHDIIRRLKEFRREQMREQVQNSIDIQKIQEILLSDNSIDSETADRIVKQARLQNQQQEQPQPTGGMQIRQDANMPKKERNIEQQVEQEAQQ